MKYLVVGPTIINDIIFADQSRKDQVLGGSIFCVAGIKLWCDDCLYLSNVGEDFDRFYGDWMRANGYGTAEGTQRYKVSVWQKVAGGAQYVNGSTYYIKTDGQNYRCVISVLDPAASYRLTISYDSSRYYLYGGLKVEGIAG